LGLPPQPFRFFNDLWETFHPRGRISLLLAFWRDHPTAALILFKFGKRVSAEFAASHETFRHMSPNHLLFWKGIEAAYREGYEIFDFGRTSPLSRELMDFKGRWGTTVTELPQYFYPRQDGARVAQDQRFGYRGMKEVCSRTPEIVLPHLGRFFYSHIG
jgi:CelD/BcsL family acetyltransferase involved in cellulose biosynthesis